MDVFNSSIPNLYKTIDEAESVALDMNLDIDTSSEFPLDFDIVEIEFKTVKRVKYK